MQNVWNPSKRRKMYKWKAEEKEQKERFIEKKLKEEQPKCKRQRKGIQGNTGGVMFQKQSKKPTIRKQSECTSCMPDVTADNLTLDEATDNPPADAPTDHMIDISTCSDKGASKWKLIGNALSSVKSLKHSTDDENQYQQLLCMLWNVCWWCWIWEGAANMSQGG